MRPSNFGGKETSGTALFVYGMAWGVRNGLLDKKTYLPVIIKGRNAMVKDAVHPNGFLGYVQGTGKEPKDIIAAEVLTAKPDTLVLLDEPERHLHRSIISPLLNSLISKRRDCSFIVSTHLVTEP